MTTDLATDSTTNYLKLREAIDTAIQTFSDKLKDDEKYGKILTELGSKISNVRKEIDAASVVKPKTGKKIESEVKKSEPELVSREMSIVDVNKFIDSHSDAIFVVTGGSFNPPHNGHIGMFQKAYDALIKEGKIKPDDGKKVYGVMVPASDQWIENKLCKEVTPATKSKSPERNCSDDELAAEPSKGAIELKRIKVANRVNLCKLSCDSYEWTSDPAKFNASNMIVVNEGNDDPATSILRISDGKYRDNAYYLCGSDYYASSGAGTDDKYKFICVLRKGVKLASGRSHKQIHFDNSPTGSGLKSFNVKPDDIIVDGGGDDNDASSTMLREMLTKISKLDTSDPDVTELEDAKGILLKLVSIPVLRKLLELKYILDPSKGTQQLNYIDINLNAHRDDDLENEDKPASYLSTGLRNGGSYCYLNSALQFLFSATPLRTWIKSQSKPGDAENTIESNAIQLLKMMVESSDADSKSAVDGKKFKDNLEKLIATTTAGDDRFRVGGQNDSHEILVPILEALQEKKTDSVNSLKFREFVRHDKESVVSIPVPDNREKCVTGMIPIDDDEITSIQTALNKYLSPTVAEVDEDGAKVAVNSQIQLQFEESNQYFILCLNRTLFVNGKPAMNKKKITVDRKITVSQTYDVRGNSITEKKYNFKLRGAILKSGTAGEGHFKYISFENGPTNDPITYNDSNVYVSKPDELSGIENNSYIFLYEKDS